MPHCEYSHMYLFFFWFQLAERTSSGPKCFIGMWYDQDFGMTRGYYFCYIICFFVASVFVVCISSGPKCFYWYVV